MLICAGKGATLRKQTKYGKAARLLGVCGLILLFISSFQAMNGAFYDAAMAGEQVAKTDAITPPGSMSLPPREKVTQDYSASPAQTEPLLLLLLGSILLMIATGVRLFQTRKSETMRR
jgi:hypothetical protein